MRPRAALLALTLAAAAGGCHSCDKVESELRAREGELLVGSQLTRDQGRNLADCLAKVRALVQAAVRPPKVRRPTRPTRASQVRRVEESPELLLAQRHNREIFSLSAASPVRDSAPVFRLVTASLR